MIHRFAYFFHKHIDFRILVYSQNYCIVFAYLVGCRIDTHSHRSTVRQHFRVHANQCRTEIKLTQTTTARLLYSTQGRHRSLDLSQPVVLNRFSGHVLRVLDAPPPQHTRPKRADHLNQVCWNGEASKTRRT